MKIIKLILALMFLIILSGFVSAGELYGCTVTVTVTVSAGSVSSSFPFSRDSDLPSDLWTTTISNPELLNLEAGQTTNFKVSDCYFVDSIRFFFDYYNFDLQNNKGLSPGKNSFDSGDISVPDIFWTYSINLPVSSNFPQEGSITSDDLRSYNAYISVKHKSGSKQVMNIAPILNIVDTTDPTNLQFRDFSFNIVDSFNCDDYDYATLDCSADDVTQLKYTWNFGNGEVDYFPDSTTCYRTKWYSDGVHTATVTAKDAAGHSISDDVLVYCGSAIPTITPRIYAYYYDEYNNQYNCYNYDHPIYSEDNCYSISIPIGTEVTFIDTTVADFVIDQGNRAWDFDAFEPDSFISISDDNRYNPSPFTYSQTGIYYAKLQITDPDGKYYISYIEVSVYDPTITCTDYQTEATCPAGCYWCGEDLGKCQQKKSDCISIKLPETTCETDQDCGEKYGLWGYSCYFGQCISEIDATKWPCVESDGLAYLYEEGFHDNPIKDSPYIKSTIVTSSLIEDQCIGERVVREYYCDENDKVKYKDVPCAEGEACFDGKCVEEVEGELTLCSECGE